MTETAKLNRLKGRIREKELSYRKISEKTGISTNTLNNKINGKTPFDMRQVTQLCAVLDIPPEEIKNFFC